MPTQMICIFLMIFHPTMIMAATDLSFRYPVNPMSLLWNGWTMTNFWAGLFRINSSSVKACQRGCYQRETGSILPSTTMANSTIPYSLLTVSINCSVWLAFEAQLGSQAKMLPLWKVSASWLISRHFSNSFSGQGIIHTQKRQSSSMPRSAASCLWWDWQFHSAPLNVLQLGLNWMPCNFVIELVQISAWALLPNLRI